MKTITKIFLYIVIIIVFALILFRSGYEIGYSDGVDDAHDMWMEATDELIKQLGESSMSAPVAVTMPDGSIRLLRQIYKIEPDNMKTHLAEHFDMINLDNLPKL